MRIPVLLLLALTGSACTCTPPPRPVCRRLPTVANDLRTKEPYLAHRLQTVTLTLNDDNCGDTSLETWTVEMVDETNRPVPAEAERVDNQLRVHFISANAGAYHTTLSNGFERFQFELAIIRDRRNAAYIDLPATCLDVQRTTTGLFLCQQSDGGTVAFIADAGAPLATFESPVTAAGDKLWTWSADGALRYGHDGGCLINALGECVNGALGIPGPISAVRTYTALAPNPDTLHILKHVAGLVPGRLATFRADGGFSEVQFLMPAANNAGFVLQATPQTVFVVSALAGRDAHSCPLPVDPGADAGVLRIDAGSECQTFPGILPAGADSEGVFLRNTLQVHFWQFSQGLFSLKAAAPRMFASSSAAIPITNHIAWPVESGPLGRVFDYVLAIDDKALTYELYTQDAPTIGSDRTTVWAHTAPATTRVFFR